MFIVLKPISPILTYQVPDDSAFSNVVNLAFPQAHQPNILKQNTTTKS